MATLLPVVIDDGEEEDFKTKWEPNHVLVIQPHYNPHGQNHHWPWFGKLSCSCEVRESRFETNVII